MADRRKIFSAAGRTELATQRCILSCAWCDSCRGSNPADAFLPDASSRLPAGTPLLRIRGGDPFRFGQLSKWVAWGRQEPDATICIEGPAASFAAADRRAVAERILKAKPDALSVVVPTINPDRTAALTGARWDPLLALETLQQLMQAGLALEIVFPVHASTVQELPSVVSVVGERLPDVVITLRRYPAAKSREHASANGSANDWSELEGLSDAIAALPAALPNNLRLQLDPLSSYAACMLQPQARRLDLLSAPGRGGARPLGAVCENCAWSTRCTFRADQGAPPAGSVHPLTGAEAEALEAGRPSAMGAEPHRFHTDRAALGLPNFLCFAPWTTLTVCEPKLHPVPCALSWVETDMTPEEIALEMGTAPELERERHEQIALPEFAGPWFVTDNPRLSLMDLWNSPLLRLMRREMTGGEKSSRCRSMCRVVMGVEERGVANFQRSDDEFTPAIIANRRHLLEEINEGKNVLTAKPLDLTIGVSAHCNISCGFCDGPMGSYGDLSERRRDDIIELLPTLMGFGASGPGEPLMNKSYLELLQHISDTGYPSLRVSLTTNGTLLTPELIKRNCNVPWGSVRISLNSGSPETYARMTRGKSYFDRIMTNLDALCALRDRSPRGFTITLGLVLGKVQMGDLAKFAKIVHDHRTAIIVEPMYGNMRNLSPWLEEETLRILAEDLGSVADDYVDKNPDISRAFRAVERFARQRIETKDFAVMGFH